MGGQQSTPEPQIIYIRDPRPEPEPEPKPKPYNEALTDTGRPLVHTTLDEDLIVNDIIKPAVIDVDFKSLGGLVNLKQKMQHLIILPVKNPEIFNSKLLAPPKGILFFGPPGTGKTMLAKAIAKESGSVFINVSIANLTHESPGEARKRIVALFSLATKQEPAIIFLDECDSFLGKFGATKDEVMISMKSEFMSLWSGFNTNSKARVMVLATTNRPWELDLAIQRRFTHCFEFSMPTREERTEIFEVTLREERVEANINYYFLAGLCDGFTGSNIADICSKAVNISLIEQLEAKEYQERRPVSQHDLESVLAESKQTSAAVLEYASRQVMAGLAAPDEVALKHEAP